MEKSHIEALLLLAGIEYSQLYEIKNGYTPNWPEAEPWWLVKTEFGLIKIGWRKRVINIDWSDTELRSIITNRDVTKTEEMVHAWGYSAAVEHLIELGLKLKRSKQKEG